MSENIIEYYFCNLKKPKSIKSVINKICKNHNLNNPDTSEIQSGQSNIDYYVSMWLDDVDCASAISDNLLYLSTFSCDSLPYAKIEIDGTGEHFFYILHEDVLMSFNSEKELHEHLNSLSEPTIESYFYEFIDKSKSNLLIRIKFSKKTQMKLLYECTQKFIENQSEEIFNELKKIINKKSRVQIRFPINFEFLNKSFGVDKANKIAKSLIFSKIKNNFLYLGYQFDDKIKIRPCSEERATWRAENNIRNNEGLLILEMLQCFCYMNESSAVNAKFRAIESGGSGVFWSRESIYIEYSPYRNKPILPARYW